MDFSGFTDTPDQAELRGVIRDFLSTQAGEGAWKRLTGELGLTALAVPEELGGMGATLAEVMVAIQETGRVLLPAPYLSTALVAALLAEAGIREFLPGLIDGTLVGALALGTGVTLAGGRVSGTAEHVLDGAVAGVLLVQAGAVLVAVRAEDAEVAPVGTLDQTRTQATVTFRDAPALRVSEDASRAEELLRVALAAESAAGAVKCLEMTVEYLLARVQFGKPIGEFQALKHRCADMAVAAESAWMTAHAAIRAAASDPGEAGDPEELEIVAPLAKRYCADAYFRVAAETIQLHGGIGFTWEHDAHRYFKRAKSIQLLHGTPGELRRLIAARAGLTC